MGKPIGCITRPAATEANTNTNPESHPNTHTRQDSEDQWGEKQGAEENREAGKYTNLKIAELVPRYQMTEVQI